MPAASATFNDRCARQFKTIGESVSISTATSHRVWVAALLAVALVGCASRPAPDFGGRWKPVNHFAAVPDEIPLQKTYVYYPSPMDGTLKTMLERWSQDSQMPLSYLHPSDFTLHQAVAQIHTTSVQDAVAQLSSAYSAQGVSVTVENGQIVVRAATPAASSASMSGETAPSSEAAQAEAAHVAGVAP